VRRSPDSQVRVRRPSARSAGSSVALSVCGTVVRRNRHQGLAERSPSVLAARLLVWDLAEGVLLLADETHGGRPWVRWVLAGAGVLVLAVTVRPSRVAGRVSPRPAR
jgi:hypothetical protein